MHINTSFNAMKNYLKFVCFIGILFLFPLLSYAADSTSTGVQLYDTSSGSLFTPSSADQSIIYLGELFGSMPPLLAGTGSSIMGQLFKTLNNMALALGVILAGYTTFVGIMNTAGEGEMLGKSWNAIWIPIRTVAGIALLIPTASGYCLCQIFMMWLVVQGIGAADSLTTTVVNYMYSGQQIFVKAPTQQTDGDGSYNQYDTMVKNIYEGLTCMQAYLKEYPSVNSLSIPAPTLDNATNPTTITYHFAANRATSSTDPVTGAVTQTPVAQSCGYIVVTGVNSKSATYIEQGYAAIMPSLNAAAYFMVNSTAGSTTNSDGSVTDPVEDDVMTATFQFVGADFLTEVEKTYQSYVTQAENQNLAEGTDGSGNSDYEDVKAYGWASLGSLYWKLADSYSTESDSGSYNNGWDTKTTPYVGAGANPNTSAGEYPANVWMYAGGDSDGWALQFINDLIKTRDNGGTNSNDLQKDFDSGKYSATGAVAAISLGVLEAMTNKFEENGNPMVLAQELGHDITIGIEDALTAFQFAMGAVSLSIIGLGVSTAEGSFITAPSGIDINLAYLAAISLILITVLPGLFAFMAVMGTLGGTLAVVIPFIPVLAYSLAVIAWLIATLETIVAAPIVAIGVLHPDGQHPMFGKAEPAVMLIINMFLRPGLLVIGFIAGIILSSISIQFINLAFNSAMDQILGDSGTVSGIETMLFIATYVALILACVNQSFSVIEAIPNGIMRWIGHEGTRFNSGSDAMQKIQGSQEGSAKSSADSAVQSGSDASHGPEKAVSGLKDKAFVGNSYKKKPENNTPTSTGQTQV